MNEQSQTAQPANWKDAVRSVVDDWDGRHIVTSPDIDGILSALAVGLHSGAKIIGVYTTRYYLGFDEPNQTIARKNARNALWLDHDISQPGIRCIGQHLVNHSQHDQLPRRHPVSFNPNIFFGQAYPDSFKGPAGKSRDKYPFATVHLLMSALGIDEPQSTSTAYHMLAHADGACRVCKKYPSNAQIWYDLMFDSSDTVLTELVGSGYCVPKEVSVKHDKVFNYLKTNCIQQPTTQKNLNTYLENFNKCLQWLSALFQWAINPLPSCVTTTICGKVETPDPNSIQSGKFDQFMLDEEIFSHAIIFHDKLRYTKDLTI